LQMLEMLDPEVKTGASPRIRQVLEYLLCIYDTQGRTDDASDLKEKFPVLLERSDEITLNQPL